ncbi:MAG: hypothetical protein WEB87_01000 [Bacteriovoracaceae bacterium]
MRCCRVLFIALYSMNCFGGVFTLEPFGEGKAATGDVLEVTIKPENGENKIPKLQGKRIGGVFYVIEQEGDKLSVMVANPQSVEEANPSGENKFLLKGFDITYKKTPNLKEFLIEDVQYALSKASGWLLWLAALVFAGAAPFLYKKYKNRKGLKALKEKKKKKMEEILKGVSEAKTREEVEKIYSWRSDLAENFSCHEKARNNFFRLLNEIQYKPEWTAEEEVEIKRSLAAFKKDLSLKRGI